MTFVPPPLHAGSEITEIVRQQKRELAILNVIIETLSASYNLKETLESALEIVLSVVNSSTGWICLLDEASCTSFVGYKGLCLAEDGKGTPCLARCVCDRVRKTGEAVVVKKLNPGCPLLTMETIDGQAVAGHISIPLVTKSRIVGQLNVAFDDPRQADEMDTDLLKTIAPQLAVAVENARLWQAVQEKEERRKELLKKVVVAQEEERRRISRELHDDMGQELTSLLVRLKVLEKSSADAASHELIASLKSSVATILESIHDLAVELRPTTLDDLGLVPALTQYVRLCPAHLGLEVDLEVIGLTDQRLPHEIETTLYRVIQESLTNVARHAQAQRASILLQQANGLITAIIEDHGVGFDPSAAAANTGPRRLGLYGMEERVALVGGRLTIESSPGTGTTLYVEVPLAGG